MLKTDAKKLETRDFISVGIFSLIYAVVAFVIGGVAQMTPVTFPFMPMIVGLLAVSGVGVAVCAAHLRGDDPRMAYLRQHQRPRRSFYPEEFP